MHVHVWMNVLKERKPHFGCLPSTSSWYQCFTQPGGVAIYIVSVGIGGDVWAKFETDVAT